jgi:hypothetical protein
MSQDNGLNLFVPWGLVEWAVSGLGTFVVGLAVWVLRTAGRVNRLEDQVKDARDAEREVRAETKSQLEALNAELNSIARDLPSKTFIEGQFLLVNQRLDQLAGRGR